jgi:hypothetical protein
MEREYKSLVHNGTWDLVPLPQDRAIVSGKWCYRAKTDAKGTVSGREVYALGNYWISGCS